MLSKTIRKILYVMILIGAILIIGALISGCQRAGDDIDINQTEEKEEANQSETPKWTYDGGETVVPREKSEVVTASAEASGEIYKITSSVTIENGSAISTIKDISNLSDIKNRNGAEEFDYIEDQGILYWENQGNSIEYEGEGKEKLPVDLKITYYLNDKEVTAKEISGKSGHIKIRIDYINNTFKPIKVDGSELSSPVPFGAITAILLPENTLKNFKGEGVRLSKVSSQDLVMGMVFPGLKDALNLSENEIGKDLDLPSYIEFEADTEDFKMDFSTTIIQNGLLEDMEDSSEISELVDSMGDLKDATNSLVNGAVSLLNGERQFKTGIDAYLDGVSGVGSGLGSLVDGANTLNSQKQSLIDGANSLSSGLLDLKNYVVQLQAYVPASLSEEEKAQYLEMLKGLENSLGQLREGADGLSAGAYAFGDGLSQLSQGAGEIKSGVDQLSGQNSTIKDGFNSIINGTSSLKDGLIKYRDEGISELTDTVTGDLGDLDRRFRALKERDKSYTSYSGADDKTKSSVTYIIETDEIS